MTDSDPALRSMHAGVAGEQDASLATVPVELANILGEETAQAVIGGVGRIEQIETLARTRNPFAEDRRSSDVDISSLKPKLAEIVTDYSEGRWPKENFGLPPGERLPRRQKIKLRRIMLRLGNAGATLHNRLERDTKAAKSTLEQLGEQVDSASSSYAESDSGLDVATAGSFMDSLTEAAERLPATPTVLGLNRIYEAFFAPTVQSRKTLGVGVIGRSSSGVVPSPQRLFQIASAEKVSAEQHTVRKNVDALESSIDDVRDQGTHYHKQVVGLLRTAQVDEAVRLLDVIDAAQQQFPPADQLAGDQLKAALASEQYLADLAIAARETIRVFDPTRLGSDKLLQETVKRARSRSLAGALATRRSMEASRVEDRRSIEHLPIAKDVLIGGRRLRRPGEGRPRDDDLRTQADLSELTLSNTMQAALGRQEVGLIMAIVTGNFSNFMEVVKQVDNRSTVPVRQARAFEAVKEFDLEASLTRIRELLHTRAEREKLKEILGVKVIDNVVGKTVTATLEQQRAGADAALHS